MRPEPRGLAMTGLSVALILAMGIGGAVLLWAHQDEFLTVRQPWTAGFSAEPLPFAWAVIFAFVMATAIPIFLLVLGGLNGQPRQSSSLAVGVSAFLGVLLNGTIWTQRGLGPDQIGQVSLLGPLLAAIGVTVVVSGLMMLGARCFQVPEDPVVPPRSAGIAETMADTFPRFERTMTWSGRTSGSWVLGAQVLGLLGLVGSQVQAATVTGVAWLVVANLMIGLIALLRAPWASASVRLMPGLLLVRGAGGVDWRRLRLIEIDSFSVIGVQPKRDFGGYGRRVADDGTVGYITGRGSALRIVPIHGPAVVITIRDAENATEVLEILLKHRWEDVG